MFSIRETEIPGCVEVTPTQYGDDRGVFINLFTTKYFAEKGMNTSWKNVVCSKSIPGTLRGLHFQIPPMEQAKLVTCVEGDIVDVVVDLRVGSPTYGRSLAVELSAETARVLHVPAGLAHGFYVPTRKSTVVYCISNDYSPAHDRGILWSSVDLRWPTEKPLLSEKDGKLPRLEDFQSPFRF